MPLDLATSPRQPAPRAYDFDRLALPVVLKDMRFGRREPGPGDRVPDFDLPLLDGKRLRSADLLLTGPVLLVFGSSTCPMTDAGAQGLVALHRRYGDQVRFVMVNVREAHPGAAFPQPHGDAAKVAAAARLRDLFALPFDVAVDDVDGSFHRAMGSKPHAAYLIGKDGRIRFRAHWANVTEALAGALEAFVRGHSPSRRNSGRTMLAMWRMLPSLAPTLDRAGRGAWTDMWRVAPPLALAALLLRSRAAGRRQAPLARQPGPALSIERGVE